MGLKEDKDKKMNLRKLKILEGANEETENN